jgi:DNA-binding MarR family transcriptional regulator
MLDIVQRLIGAISAADHALLREIAEHKSCPVEHLSNRLGVTLEAALERLGALESEGLVRVSQDKGCLHARIVAVTQKGREHLREGDGDAGAESAETVSPPVPLPA